MNNVCGLHGQVEIHKQFIPVESKHRARLGILYVQEPLPVV